MKNVKGTRDVPFIKFCKGFDIVPQKLCKLYYRNHEKSTVGSDKIYNLVVYEICLHRNVIFIDRHNLI